MNGTPIEAGVSQDKVSSRSIDGLKLRRHLLRGAVVVFVTAGYSGKKFIFDRVRVCRACGCPRPVSAGVLMGLPCLSHAQCLTEHACD